MLDMSKIKWIEYAHVSKIGTRVDRVDLWSGLALRSNLREDGQEALL
jgi:hypothetical protein